MVWPTLGSRTAKEQNGTTVSLKKHSPTHNHEEKEEGFAQTIRAVD